MQALLEEAGTAGAVYASMGTLCNFGAGEFVEIARALSALPNLVIWKLAPGDLPGNATVASLNLSATVKVRKTTHCLSSLSAALAHLHLCMHAGSANVLEGAAVGKALGLIGGKRYMVSSCNSIRLMLPLQKYVMQHWGYVFDAS